ncbi:hypothetical protein K2Q08_03510, partial [Patescibacteria group bacterium]|nr:hypothetical protein [Patescibacteria group bacterium]
ASAGSGSAPSGVTCGSYDITSVGTPPVPFVPAPTGWGPWTSVSSANAATTTFTLTFPGYSYCALVEVAKVRDISTGVINTNIYSHGFNTCVTNAQSRIERELKASY